MIQETRQDFGDDVDFVLSMFERACYGAYSADVEYIEKGYFNDGSIRTVTVWFRHKDRMIVDVSGLGPFQMVKKIIEKAGLK